MAERAANRADFMVNKLHRGTAMASVVKPRRYTGRKPRQETPTYLGAMFARGVHPLFKATGHRGRLKLAS